MISEEKKPVGGESPLRLSQTLVLIGGFAIHLYNGCLYLWGSIAPYVISYFYHFGGKDGQGQPEVSMYDSVTVIPILISVMAFSNPTGAFLFKVVPAKIMVGIGSLLGVIAFAVSASAQTFLQYIICFSVLYGFGIGMGYFTPLACGWEWMPERKGLVTGVILGAFGFGAFIFNFVAQAIVNPENVQPVELSDGRLYYAPEIAERVPKLMYVLAVCFGGLGLISVLFTRRNPAAVELQETENAD